MLGWLRGLARPTRLSEDTWTVRAIYNGLAHYDNGHVHRVAPAWWHLDISPEMGAPRPNQCPLCDHRDEGDGWVAARISEGWPDLHVRKD